MTTLYARRGNRYHAVHDTAAFEGLPNGSWLVVVRNGHRAIRRAVGDGAELARLAASVRLADVIADAIVRHSMAEPSTRPTEHQAWRAWAEPIGEAVAAEVMAMAGDDAD